MDSTEDFAVKDCALIALATGTRAQTLRGLRDNLLGCHPGSIYYHFWGGLLHSRFEQREYNNDFAAWAAHALHDKVLAERLAVIDPTAFGDVEDLRRELIDLLEQRLDELEYLAWAQPDQQFEFLRSQIVVFDTGKRVARPENLSALVPQFSAGSIFYHFIDALASAPLPGNGSARSCWSWRHSGSRTCPWAASSPLDKPGRVPGWSCPSFTPEPSGLMPLPGKKSTLMTETVSRCWMPRRYS